MSMSTTKCRGAVAPTLQQHHRFSLRSIPQIVRRQRVSPATMAWNFLTPDLGAIDIAEVGNRRTISTKHAPATIILYGLTVADRPGPVIPRDGTPAGKRPLAPDGFESMHRTPQCTHSHNSALLPGGHDLAIVASSRIFIWAYRRSNLLLYRSSASRPAEAATAGATATRKPVRTQAR
jgi:hypothetical protein